MTDYREVGRPAIEGELNINEFVKTQFGLVLLKRVPKDNPQIWDSISVEYGAIGFFEEGGSFKRRSFEEQLHLAEDAAFYQLRVLLPASVKNETIYYPFLADALTYDEYLANAAADESVEIVSQLFEDLRSAHTKGIVYGDRWPPNILVTQGEGVVNIDFDIELTGFPAVEFETAQAIFYTLCAGKKDIIPSLVDILISNDGWFNYALVEKFLIGHGNFFATDPKFGDFRKLISRLLFKARKQREKIK
ncbi:hypothetical protein A3F29_04075 [Candidatus Roizmanbacteria bacterium RIFCSPHIGHO2_12_FULL_33_9]|uniref:Protein kinase domain-containing protein n=1 Tax=Candidatus Roizmanbacteria bacterium RIFCSPHIGHO2_12_FULL_33_9 TaxID=1802045 RepID=A0A1F7HKJ2_9BACT|nr:MAG: hypothetical protein A3F29_04075 [Candidatus Roizmanbacteria bacterium RIFCSPHIGHO2_12_FULL_33_9]